MIFQLGNCPHTLSGVKVRKQRTMSQGWRHEGTAMVLTHVNICVMRSHGNREAIFLAKISAMVSDDYGGRMMS